MSGTKRRTSKGKFDSSLDAMKDDTSNASCAVFVAAQPGFPGSFREGRHSNRVPASAAQRTVKGTSILDWKDTMLEVRSFGSRGMLPKKKKIREDEEYRRLTG